MSALGPIADIQNDYRSGQECAGVTPVSNLKALMLLIGI